MVSIPSLPMLQRIHTEMPSKLTNRQLIRKYASLKATKIAWTKNSLPNSFYVGVADAGGVTGRVPKDVMALVNIDETLSVFSKEIKKRNLKFDIII